MRLAFLLLSLVLVLGCGDDGGDVGSLPHVLRISNSLDSAVVVQVSGPGSTENVSLNAAQGGSTVSELAVELIVGNSYIFEITESTPPLQVGPPRTCVVDDDAITNRAATVEAGVDGAAVPRVLCLDNWTETDI